MKVDATLKFFPLHFTVTNDEDEFFYYINFNPSRAPTPDVHDLKIEARGNFNIVPTAAIAAKYSKQEKCGSQVTTVVVITSLWILVDTFYISDCWLSYSFSSPKYLDSKLKKDMGVFSDRHKRQLFDIDPTSEVGLGFEVKRKLELLKKKRNHHGDDVVYKNKQIAVYFNRFRIKQLAETIKTNPQNAKDAKSRREEIHRTKMSRKAELNAHHDFLKQQAADKILGAEMKRFKFHHQFSWLYVLRIYQVLIEIKLYIGTKGKSLWLESQRQKKAVQLQRFYRGKLYRFNRIAT